MPILPEAEMRAACEALSAVQSFHQPRSAASSPPSGELTSLLDEIQTTAALPLSQSITLPAAAYTSQEMFDWEVEHLFRTEWMPVAHLSQLPKPGDYINVDLLGEPLLVIRGKDDTVRVLSRVCPHRAMDIMPEGFGYEGHADSKASAAPPRCGSTQRLVCPYHFWSFDLAGQLKGAPEMQQAEDFDPATWSLKSFPSTLWNGFVMVNFDGRAEPPETRLGGMTEDLSAWFASDLQVALETQWECQFNWKVLCENFMESYHHIGAHAKTLQPLMPAAHTWAEEEKPGYIRCHLPAREGLDLSAGGLPEIPDLGPEADTGWGLFQAFPAFLIATTRQSLIWYRLQPQAPDRMQLLTTLLVPRATLEGDAWQLHREREKEDVTTFHLEDMEVCTAVQRGFLSEGYQRGRLSHLEMPIWLLQRYLAARARGTWPATDTPPAPSQQP